MAGGVEPHAHAAVGGGDAAARVHGVDDRLGHHVARAPARPRSARRRRRAGWRRSPGWSRGGRSRRAPRARPSRSGAAASESSSRPSAPSSRAIRSTSGVASGWLVLPRPSASASPRSPPPAASTTVSACTVRRAAVAARRHRGEPAVALGRQAHEAAWPPTPRRRSRARPCAAPRTISAPVRSPACSRRLRVAPPQRSRRRRPSSRLKATPERLEPGDGVGAALGQPAHQLGPRGAVPGGEGVLEVRLGASRRRRARPGCRPAPARCCRRRGPTWSSRAPRRPASRALSAADMPAPPEPTTSTSARASARLDTPRS